MDIRELQQTYEHRVNGFKGFIHWDTNGNEDMRQEAHEAIWRGLLKDPLATDAYLRTRIRWRTRDVSKLGKSIDTHKESRKQAKLCRLNDGDAEDEVMTECMRDKFLPLDEQVINKIDSERFLDTLDMTERAIVLDKLKGLLDRDVMKELGMSQERYGCVKAGLKPKIEAYYTSQW
jgi:hypothetical protein